MTRHTATADKLKLTFLGGVGTVTGSKYLLEIGRKRVLVDCGLFQGFKQLRLLNWAPLPVAPSSISAVVLTHAHLDHSGYLPLLVKNGFTGKIYCTEATRDLCAILLPDSGFIQEKDAEFANRHGFSKHRPALPLYTRADADRVLKRFRPIVFDEPFTLSGGIEIVPHVAGHILGAAIMEIRIDGTRIVFSGDLGRIGSPTMLDPVTVPNADYLLVESTYGDRRHEQTSVEDKLAEIVTRTAARGGSVLIASFAVGRAQTLMYYLHRLKQAGRIPDLPVFLDSPMAIDASDTYRANLAYQRLSSEECRAAFSVARYVHEPEQSQALDRDPMPKIVIASSGMATGGRILHHLKSHAPDPRNTILFSGFQAGGTRGAAMISGADSIKIHGQYVSVRAEIDNLSMLSAHADANEIMAWLHGFQAPPRLTFVTHGEPPAADALRLRIQEELGWACQVPAYRDVVLLDRASG